MLSQLSVKVISGWNICHQITNKSLLRSSMSQFILFEEDSEREREKKMKLGEPETKWTFLAAEQAYKVQKRSHKWTTPRKWVDGCWSNFTRKNTYTDDWQWSTCVRTWTQITCAHEYCSDYKSGERHCILTHAQAETNAQTRKLRKKGLHWQSNTCSNTRYIGT